MKVIVVDDDPVQLDMYRLALGGQDHLTLVGAYADPQQAYDALYTTLPDLMLTDINMPNMSGIQLIKKAKAKLPDLEMVAITSHDDMPTVLDALKAGAVGYLLKNISNADLVAAISEIENGGVPITPKIARRIIANLQTGDTGNKPDLSSKERDILRQISLGLSYKEIARKMSLSTHAVHWHVKGIYKKLEVSSRNEALTAAKRVGLL